MFSTSCLNDTFPKKKMSTKFQRPFPCFFCLFWNSLTEIGKNLIVKVNVFHVVLVYLWGIIFSFFAAVRQLFSLDWLHVSFGLAEALFVYMCVWVCSRFPAFQQEMLVSFLKQLKIVCSHLVAFLFITSSIFSSFFQYFLFSFIPSIIRCSNVVFSFSFEDL